ncbi:MAG: right-handed parallel beta-helix repeat-containing protein [Sphingopyxis sp.]|nr:right-handed parallel beta-helix repeat-containing protein [Sphingopyxis sp.]
MKHEFRLTMALAVSAVTGLSALTLPGAAMARVIEVAAGDDAQTRLQEALIMAQPGDVVQIGAGTFDLTDGLSLDVDGVTVRGAGMENTILNFRGQQGAGEGLLVTSDDVVLRDFTVRDTRGDGIKSKGADRIVYLSLRVDWSGGPLTANGAYGVYPVESEHVLVDGVIVRGASDAGIYVGQSRHIVVRDSVVVENVAGIEIENSYFADVHDNVATGNTGGVLVFDLPGLPQQGGHSVRIFDNVITNNMTPNFAPPGNIVAQVPTGTGIIIMANRDVEIFDNVLQDNGTANIMITGYRYGAAPEGYNPLPVRIRAQDNLHGRAGYAPAFPGGAEIAAAFGGAIPPVLWDGAGQDIKVNDPVAALSLGLADLNQPREAAQPSPVDLTGEPGWGRLRGVTLPDNMERAAALP